MATTLVDETPPTAGLTANSGRSRRRDELSYVLGLTVGQGREGGVGQGLWQQTIEEVTGAS